MRKGEQGLEGEEKHHNQTCLSTANSGKGNYFNIGVIA